MYNNNHFTFIGGGSIGPVLLMYLAKLIREKNTQLLGYTFHLIDPKGFCNGGIAYGECAPSHILNTLPSEMSPWEKDAFYTYVCSIGRDTNPLKFHLRSDYKTFLQNEFEKAKNILQSHGVTFMEHRKKAYVKCTDNNRFMIVDENKNLLHPTLTHLQPQQIILTVGYGPNMNFEHLWGSKNYVHSFYPINNFLETIEKKEKPIRIAVFGSAAGLYDFVISLPLKPEETNLFVFSSAKKGLEVRNVETEHLLKDLPLKWLTSLDGKATVSDIEKAIFSEFADAQKRKAGPNTWVAFRIMGIIGKILSNVDVHVAKEFRRSPLFKKIKRLGNPTTQFSSNILSSYHPQFISSDVCSENIQQLPNDTFRITVGTQTYVVDCIVNLTGHGRHNSDILEDLKQQGLTTIQQNLSILQTDETGFHLVPSGIACVGPATHFGTDGIESFAYYVEKLATNLVTHFEVSNYTPIYS